MHAVCLFQRGKGVRRFKARLSDSLWHTLVALLLRVFPRRLRRRRLESRSSSIGYAGRDRLAPVIGDGQLAEKLGG